MRTLGTLPLSRNFLLENVNRYGLVGTFTGFFLSILDKGKCINVYFFERIIRVLHTRVVLMSVKSVVHPRRSGE